MDRHVYEIASFVPILIHRQALEQMKGLLYNKSHPVASSALAGDE